MELNKIQNIETKLTQILQFLGYLKYDNQSFPWEDENQKEVPVLFTNTPFQEATVLWWSEDDHKATFEINSSDMQEAEYADDIICYFNLESLDFYSRDHYWQIQHGHIECPGKIIPVIWTSI